MFRILTCRIRYLRHPPLVPPLRCVLGDVPVLPLHHPAHHLLQLVGEVTGVHVLPPAGLQGLVEPAAVLSDARGELVTEVLLGEDEGLDLGGFVGHDVGSSL